MDIEDGDGGATTNDGSGSGRSSRLNDNVKNVSIQHWLRICNGM